MSQIRFHVSLPGLYVFGIILFRTVSWVRKTNVFFIEINQSYKQKPKKKIPKKSRQKLMSPSITNYLIY